MGNKTLVIGELLKTVEVSLNTIATVLEGNISTRELGKYMKKMEHLGQSIEKLTGIVDGNKNYGVLEPQMESIRNKYQLLTSMVR